MILIYNVGVIGDYDSVCGFSAAGFGVFPAENAEQAGEILKTLIKNNYGIIYITEPYMERLAAECARYDAENTPCVIPIPASAGASGYGESRLKRCVERAVGSDIIFGEQYS